MKVVIVQCVVCGNVMYSRTEFDKRTCSCKTVSVTGNPNSPKILTNPSKVQKAVVKKATVVLPYTSAELFNDYNDEVDVLGTINSPRTDKASYPLLIEHTKMVLKYNVKKNNTELVDLFKNQLNRLREEYARFQLKSK